eukprot:gene14181-16720_t
MLYNPNNATIVRSPLTTHVEVAVTNDLARMIGYTFNKDITPWGHLTSGGTVSNFEAHINALWVKFVPLALKSLILKCPEASGCACIQVTLFGQDKPKKLVDCTPWECLNLGSDQCAELPYLAGKMCDIDPSKMISLIKEHHPSMLGMHQVLTESQVNTPVALVSSAGHYSLSKSMAMMGLGSKSLYFLGLDKTARMHMHCLQAHLNTCLEKKIPIFCVTGILGTTEMGAVDDIQGIYDLREEYRPKGIDFHIHVDGAYGGYYLSCIREDYPLPDIFQNLDEPPFPSPVNKKQKTNNTCTINALDARHPKDFCSDYLIRQLEACCLSDSMTIDPHKSGHIGYPAPNGTWLTPVEIASDSSLVKLLTEIGGDHGIVCYLFNYKRSNGEWNTDYHRFIQFNEDIIKRFHPMNEAQDLAVEKTKISSHYGGLQKRLSERIGLTNVPLDQFAMPLIRSTMMTPFANELKDGNTVFTTVFELMSRELQSLALEHSQISQTSE